MNPAAPREAHHFVVPYQPPYDWDTLVAFLSPRATPGVEIVEPRRYRRTIAVGGLWGTIDIGSAEGASSLSLDVRVQDVGVVPAVVDRVRRMFDVDLDPSVLWQAPYNSGDA